MHSSTNSTVIANSCTQQWLQECQQCLSVVSGSYPVDAGAAASSVLGVMSPLLGVTDTPAVLIIMRYDISGNSMNPSPPMLVIVAVAVLQLSAT
jgi:hypothetical protein